MGSKEQIFDHPSHPYTRALLSAAPAFTRKEKAEKKRVLLEGDLPTPFNPPKGCRFVSRSQLKNQALVMVQETIYPFTKEVEELKVAIDDPGIVYVGGQRYGFQPLQTDPGLHVRGPEHGNLPEAEHSGFHGDLLLMI